jgi:hypothetical protein
MKKTTAIGVAVGLVLTLFAGPAVAASTIIGEGLTAKGAAFGFVAFSSHSGQLQYTKGSFIVHCSAFASYHRTKTAKGHHKITVTARRCFDRTDGKRRFARAVLIDRGTPGIGVDIVRVWWSRDQWPVTPTNAGRHDVGVISAGNLMFHAG